MQVVDVAASWENQPRWDLLSLDPAGVSCLGGALGARTLGHPPEALELAVQRAVKEPVLESPSAMYTARLAALEAPADEMQVLAGA